MRKSLMFWLYFILSIVLAVYFATRIITSHTGRGPISTVKHIEITVDDKDIDVEPIGVAIGIRHGTNLRSLDLHQINNRIMTVPGIKNSSVRRLPNGDLKIKTQQHNAVAMWTDGVLYYPLSDDGTKIEKPMERPDNNTIVISGEIPNNLTEIINSVSALSEYIDYINMVESRRWNIHTKNGTVIYLPENNPVAAINKISVLNQTHKILSRKLSIIDMRDNARILVKLKK